jgi:hypothetical protein
MKQQTRRPIIEYKVAKPFVDAAALGVGSSAFAIVLQGPAFNWGLLGAGFSLFWFWGSNNLTRPKRSKKSKTAASVGAGTVVVNSATGSRKVALGFNYEPRFVSRETWGEILSRWVWGKDEPAPRQVIDKPTTSPEFVFLSHYEGQPVELREDDVRRFLRTAWKKRQRGRGLSYRYWVREWRDREQWYKDLGPHWYRAFLVLLREAQRVRERQLVVCTGPNWYSLARDPHITLGILREAEAMKGRTPGNATPPDIDISYDRGESSVV